MYCCARRSLISFKAISEAVVVVVNTMQQLAEERKDQFFLAGKIVPDNPAPPSAFVTDVCLELRRRSPLKARTNNITFVILWLR